MSLLEIKKREIYQVLVECDGNKTKAAERLEISLRSLRNLTNSDPYFKAFRGSLDDDLKKRNQSMDIQKKDERKEVQVSEVFDTKEVVSTLNGLMKRVTQEECSANTVNAACNCASQIVQLLRVHLDVERLKIKFGR